MLILTNDVIITPRPTKAATTVSDAAIVLSRYLEGAEGRALVREKRCMEVAASTGFVGIVAAALGAKKVRLKNAEGSPTRLPVRRRHAAGGSPVCPRVLFKQTRKFC